MTTDPDPQVQLHVHISLHMTMQRFRVFMRPWSLARALRISAWELRTSPAASILPCNQHSLMQFGEACIVG